MDCLNFFDTNCFEMVFVFKEFGVMWNLDIMVLKNADHLQLMFNIWVNTAKLELLFVNFARNFRMLSSVNAATEMMTPSSK